MRETIYRDEAIEAVAEDLASVLNVSKDETRELAEHALSALPSAEAEATVIRSRTLMSTKDFKEWAKRVRETNPNAVVIPCDAEVVSAEAEEHRIYKDGYNTGKAHASADAVQGWIPCSERLPSEDGHYLCCNNGYLPYVGCFRNGRWSDFDCTIVHADAWMPTPEPYEEVER